MILGRVGVTRPFARRVPEHYSYDIHRLCADRSLFYLCMRTVYEKLIGLFTTTVCIYHGARGFEKPMDSILPPLYAESI